MQEVIAYSLVGIAIIFLVKKYFFASKKSKSNCDTDCGCA